MIIHAHLTAYTQRIGERSGEKENGMTTDEIIRGLLQFRRRLVDDGHVYYGFMFQVEFEALNGAIEALRADTKKVKNKEKPYEG